LAINRWREVSYQEDGVSRFECLSCYRRFDSRTTPIREYTPNGFVFCPFCGTRWEGEQTNQRNEEIEMAMLDRPRAVEPYWGLERRRYIPGAQLSTIIYEWQQVASRPTRERILELYRQRLEEAAEDEAEMKTWDFPGWTLDQYRIVRVAPDGTRKQVLPRPTE